MLGPVYLLSGDSLEPDPAWQHPLRQRLEPLFSEWIDQREILKRAGEARYQTAIGRRLAILEKLLPNDDAAKRAVLIGRSSGARTATLFAMKRPVAAVICLGYPFRAPQLVIEPERFSHLARISSPTLIIQGAADPYGGETITETYAFSANVSINLVSGDHELARPEAEWDELARNIAIFCGCVERGEPTPLPPFDETYYLTAYADVQNAVASGDLMSGEYHYVRYGREERRRFRILRR